MKQILKPVVFLVASLSFAGCGHSKIKTDEAVPAPVPATQTQRSLNLEMTHFAFNSAVLTDLGKATLREDAQVLKTDANVKIQAQGFCDDRGSVAYNLALGARRADAVKTYLETLGIPGERITTVSFGKARPLDAQNNESAWALNRRASFAVLRNEVATR